MAMACSFQRATDDEIRLGDAAIVPDVRLLGDGSQAFQADANVTCVQTSPMTANLPPDILIVLDRSGSMNEDLSGTMCANGCGANSKWSIATTTLRSFLPTVEGIVNWGLKLFATPDNVCIVSNTVEIPPQINNAAAINARLMMTDAGSSTPTTSALLNAAAYLKTLTDPRPKFILLATDGVPTCGTAPCAAGVNSTGMANQCDDANAIAMVKTVHDMGFPTFVLGIGTSKAPGDGTLSQMAINGGYPRTGTPAYYPIDKAQDLEDAFQSITGMVSSCFYTISPSLTGAQQVAGVKADGVALSPGDYMILGNSGVQLIGQACAAVTSGTIKKIDVQVDCIG
jgi:hypothetical protein